MFFPIPLSNQMANAYEFFTLPSIPTLPNRFHVSIKVFESRSRKSMWIIGRSKEIYEHPDIKNLNFTNTHMLFSKSRHNRYESRNHIIIGFLRTKFLKLIDFLWHRYIVIVWRFSQNQLLKVRRRNRLMEMKVEEKHLLRRYINVCSINNKKSIYPSG